MAELEVYLQGGSPWGFRLQGGKEFRLPLKIAKINPGGKADIGGVTVGDHVREINGVSTDPMYHAEAMNAVKKSQYSLSLVLSRSDEDDTTNVIQSIGISPEDTSTRVSLKIGRKTPTSSAPSSPKSSRRVSETIVPQTMLMDESIPHGQGYMKRLLGSQEDLLSLNDESARNTKHNIFVRGKSVDPSYFNDDLPPQERVRSKTLPRKQVTDSNNNSGDNMIYSSNSLPRKSDGGPPNKAPNWYKQMYKEINSSIEGESHLTKLLTSDAKRGAFRKYDGMSMVDGPTNRNASPESVQRSSTVTTANVPRRLQGGGRSVANHANRKSLPNIHAANFNFMDPTRTGSSTVQASQKPLNQSNIQSNRRSVNSEWYKQLQRGGEIPEVGLAKTVSLTKTLSQTSALKQASSYLEDVVKKEEVIVKPSTVNVEYNNPPDFLELRKQELKNCDIERERESLREKRERERLEEESRLQRQREMDRLRIEAEERKQLEMERKQMEVERKQMEMERKQMEMERREDERRRAKEEKERRLEEEAMRPKLPEYGRAKYAFHPQSPGELEFKRGDKISLIRSIDDNWMEGTVNGDIGIFPVAYIELLEDVKEPELEVTSYATIKPFEPSNKQSTFAPVNGHEPKSFSSVKAPQTNNYASVEAPQTNNYASVKAPEINSFSSVKASQPNNYASVKAPQSNNYASVEPPTNNYAPVKAPQTNNYASVKAPSKVIEEEPSIQVHEEKVMESGVDTFQNLLDDHVEPQMNVEPGLAKAKYTFKAESKNELPFRKGETLTLLRQIDDNWFEGCLNDIYGIFPVNYVEVIKEPVELEIIDSAPIKTPEPKISAVKEPVQRAREPLDELQAELDFEKIFNDAFQPKPLPFDEITESEQTIVKKEPITNNASAKQPIAPLQTWPIENGGNTHTTNGVVNNDIDSLIGSGEPYRTIYSYTRTNDDEVDLRVGDIVNVLEKCDDGWYVGTSVRTGMFGIFPGNYVQPL